MYGTRQYGVCVGHLESRFTFPDPPSESQKSSHGNTTTRSTRHGVIPATVRFSEYKSKRQQVFRMLSLSSIVAMDYWVVATVLSLVFLVYCLYSLHSRTSIADIPGPQPESFIFGEPNRYCHFMQIFETITPVLLRIGNVYELLQSEVGKMEFELQDQYGGIARLRAPFGVCTSLSFGHR